MEVDMELNYRNVSDFHDGSTKYSRFDGPAMNNGATYSPKHAVMSSHDLTDAQELLEGRDQLVVWSSLILGLGCL